VEARLIHRDGGFSCWVPWAAESPFEVWIAPRRHAPDIRDLSPEESDTLARLLGRVARAFGETAGNPDYNLLLHSASPRDPAAAELHWWIRFRPRMAQAAGLELLSGVGINPSSPDEDAASLRRAMGMGDGRPSGPGNRNTSAREA
jgi:UDPglucose--hexose-1-phosphate uridylyltransferase